jgi:hypothetical protein
MIRLRTNGFSAMCNRCVARATVACALALLLAADWARAEDVDVPVDLQVALAARVAAYDRNLTDRAHGRVLVWVVLAPGNADSERVAGQLETSLGKLKDIGGLPVTVKSVQYTSNDKLLERYKRESPTILYFSTGLGDKVAAMARSLDGSPMLTIAAVAHYVEVGSAVLGIESRSGKPALVVHLERARRNYVAFKPELLKLARVIR